MPDHSPPARRRPTTGSAQSVNRTAPRRTGAQRAAALAAAVTEEDPGLGGEATAKLIATAGPKAGTEYPLSGDDEIVVGRATENPISIPDTSVSRRHCAIQRRDGTWTIVDLGSGNGTLVNGERIEDETPLGNGDVITIGDTELTFHDAAEATNRRPLPVRRAPEAGPARRSIPGRPDVRSRLSRGGAPATDPAKKRKLMIIAAAAGVVVVGGFVGLKVVLDRRAAEQAALEAQRQQMLNQLREISQEGRKLVLEGQWKEAKAKFEEILAVAPDFPGVRDYLDRANIEIPNQERLAEAEAALAKNQIAAAAEALGKVSKDTQQFEKVRALRTQLDEKVSARLAEATRLMGTGGEKDVRRAAYVQVVEITDDILKMNPEHRDAKVINENAHKQIEAIDYVAPPPPPPPDRLWGPVVARFVDGDMTGALAMADDCAGRDRKCRALAKDIREFAGLYKKVESLDARGLTRLLALDREITGGRTSKMARTAGTRAANLFYKNASSAKVAGQWGRAMEWAEKALKADPTHQGAQAIVSEVRGKANDVYLQAYSLKDTDPDGACLKFRDVKQMTGPGSDLYDKANHWIGKFCAQ